MQPSAVNAFRAGYRAQIHRLYRGWLHGLAVLVSGLSVLIYAAGQLQGVSLAEYLIIPATLLFANVAEYVAHRWLGHRKTKILPLFYQRHTGDHHSFFDDELFYFCADRDLRVVFFPLYLIYVFIFALILPVGFLLHWFGQDNGAYLFAIGAISGYLLYELLHFSYHIPGKNPFRYIPGWAFLSDLHRYHHRHTNMQHANFNITLPLMDIVLGTFQQNKPTKKGR